MPIKRPSRRRFIQVTGGAAAFGVAGCLGDDGADDDPATTDDDDGVATDDDDDTGEADDGDAPPYSGPEDVELHPDPDDWDHLDDYSDIYYGEPGEVYGTPVRRTPHVSGTYTPDRGSFQYVPAEDPAMYVEAFDPLLQRLEEHTGIEWEYHEGRSLTAMVEAMRAQRLDFAGFSAGALPFAVNMAGAQPFATMAKPDGDFGFIPAFLTHADSDIDSLEDLEGRRVAHASPGSNSGDLLPRAILGDQLGVDEVEEWYGDFDYSGGHDRSIRGVEMGDYDAAPVAMSVFERMEGRDEIDPDNFKTIHEAPPQPRAGFSTHFQLHPDIQEGIRNAVVEWDFSDTVLGEHFEENDETWFKPIDYVEDWEIVRINHEFNHIEYTEDAIDEF